MPKSEKTEAFLALIENNKRVLYTIAAAFCRGIDDRNDLIQEIVLKLWRSFDGYNPQYGRSSWIYRIALNTAISLYRRGKTRSKIAAPLTESILNIAEVQDGGRPENKAKLLEQFISELKQLDKALIILYLEEKSHREIAEIMGITETNVATKIGRIKNILKQKFLKSQT